MKIQSTVDSSDKILVAFATSEKLYAKFLRWLMRSDFHHTFLFLYIDVMGAWMALDIDEHGVHLVHPKKVKKQFPRIECWRCSDDLSWGLMSMTNFVGRGYDWIGLFSGAFRLLFLRVFGREITNPIHFSKKMFCSEFVSAVIQKTGVKGTEIWKTANISPEMLHEFMINNKAFRKTNLI